MKRMVEIDDTLDSRVDSAKTDLLDAFTEWRKDNPQDEPKDWEPHDQLFEIADSATPIYNKEIADLHYLYGSDFEQAYQDAGIGDGTEDNHDAVAIFCYIEAQLWDYARELMDEAQEAYDNEPICEQCGVHVPEAPDGDVKGLHCASCEAEIEQEAKDEAEAKDTNDV